jgi:hypothetical protein
MKHLKLPAIVRINISGLWMMEREVMDKEFRFVAKDSTATVRVGRPSAAGDSSLEALCRCQLPAPHHRTTGFNAPL